MLNYIKPLFKMILGIALCFGAYPSLSKTDNQTVQITKAAQLNHQMTFEGKIVPYEVVVLRAPYESTLVHVYYQHGDRIPAGALIYKFQSKPLKEAINETKISIQNLKKKLSSESSWEEAVEQNKLKEDKKNARARYLEAKAQVNQANALWQKGILSRNEWTQEKKALQEAKKNYFQTKNTYQLFLKKQSEEYQNWRRKCRQKEGQLERLLEQQKKLMMVSPAAGVLLPPPKDSKSETHLGKLIQQKFRANEIVGMLALDEAIAVQFFSDEQDALKMQIRDPVSVQIYLAESSPIKGTLVEILPPVLTQQDQTSFTKYTLKAKLEELPESVKTLFNKYLIFGLSAKITLNKFSETQGYVVPKQAVFFEEGEPYCWVKSGKTFHQSKVQLGEITQQSVVVLAGLKEQDEVRLND